MRGRPGWFDLRKPYELDKTFDSLVEYVKGQAPFEDTARSAVELTSTREPLDQASKRRRSRRIGRP
jgi:hypothetical protein